jgi:hypothetical protein
MTWKDGSYYEGAWENGIQHGQGTMVMPNGKIKEGIFENNVWVRHIDDEDNKAQIISGKNVNNGSLSPSYNQLMRSTKASSGFQVQNNPYSRPLPRLKYSSKRGSNLEIV